ncbi:metallophosphoesterase family protein [Haloplanus halophilus]|uniref:metallophosphoesterase family protein n=1 Tax=Haloplanus halophilus TaxID=2949993 RepID=UPI00203CA8FA|nr:metallophosphoesterase [Haloplanus sp. GDY1]
MTGARRRLTVRAGGTPRTLATLRRPRASPPVTIGVIADPHVATRATGTWKAYHRTTAFLRRAVRTLNEADVDAVLVAGDLTKDGERRNFEAFDAAVAGLDAPTVVIPGNHDVPKADDGGDSLPIRAFERRYAPGGYPLVARIGPVTLVCLNSAALPDGSLRETTGGAVSRAQRARLPAVLDSAETPVVALHHTLGPLDAHDGHDRWSTFPVRGWASLRRTLAIHDVPLALTAHHHVPAATTRTGVREVVAPPACSVPHAVTTVAIGPRGTWIRTHPLATGAEVAESYRTAMIDGGLGARIVRLATDAVRRFPLVED